MICYSAQRKSTEKKGNRLEKKGSSPIPKLGAKCYCASQEKGEAGCFTYHQWVTVQLQEQLKDHQHWRHFTAP